MIRAIIYCNHLSTTCGCLKNEIEKDIFTRIVLFLGIVRFTSITTETAHYKQPVHNRTDTQRNCYHRKCSLQKLIIEGTDN